MGDEHIEEFTHAGKSFIYIDFSDVKTNEKFIELLKVSRAIIEKYPENSLYTIANLENSRFDAESKKNILEYLEYNKPYVKHSAIIGFDGIKKIMVSTVFKQSGRDNLLFAFSKEQAIELLLGNEY